MSAKIFTQIFSSSIAADYEVRHVFMDLIVLADKNGIVDMTHEAIARFTSVPVDLVRRAIEVLEKPDPQSRRKAENGCRILRLDPHREWGWLIVNYSHYRSIGADEQKREKTCERVKMFRGKKRSPRRSNASVTPCNAVLTVCNARKDFKVTTESTATTSNTSVFDEVQLLPDKEEEKVSSPAFPPLSSPRTPLLSPPYPPHLPKEEEKLNGKKLSPAKPAAQKPSDEPVEIPKELQTPEFQAAWADWMQARRMGTKPKIGWHALFSRQMKFLAGFGLQNALSSLDKSLRNGYTGLFEPEPPRPIFPAAGAQSASTGQPARQTGRTFGPSLASQLSAVSELLQNYRDKASCDPLTPGEREDYEGLKKRHKQLMREIAGVPLPAKPAMATA